MPGKDIGYIRVSTHDQNTARQLDGVHLDKVFEEHASGKNSDRPALQTCLEYVRDGDVLTVTFHKEKLEFVGNGAAGKSDAFQELQLHIIAAVAQFERALILERQREGIAVAKREGKYKNVGRKPILSDEQVGELRTKLQKGAKVAALAREYGVSRQTIYYRVM